MREETEGGKGNSCKNLAIVHRRENEALPQVNTGEGTYTRKIAEEELMGFGNHSEQRDWDQVGYTSGPRKDSKVWRLFIWGLRNREHRQNSQGR